MAIKYIKKHHVDVALVDLVLADMEVEDFDEFTGLALASMIKHKNVESRVGILSNIDLLKIRTEKLGANLKHSLSHIDACLTFSQLGTGKEVLKLLA